MIRKMLLRSPPPPEKCLNISHIRGLWMMKLHSLPVLLSEQELMFSSFSSSVYPPRNQACHQKPDYQRAAGAAWMQLSLHCWLLWGLLQWWGDQHLYGTYGERHRLLAGPPTNGYQYFVFKLQDICSTDALKHCYHIIIFRMVDPWTRSWRKPEEFQKKSWGKSALLYVVHLLFSIF